MNTWHHTRESEQFMFVHLQIWPFWPSIRSTWPMGGYLPLFSTKVHHETQKIKLWKMIFKAASWFIGSSHKFLRVHTWRFQIDSTTCFPFVAHLLVENPLNFRSWARWRSIENDMFHHLCNVLVAYQAPAVEMTRNSETLMRCYLCVGEKELEVVKFS